MKSVAAGLSGVEGSLTFSHYLLLFLMNDITEVCQKQLSPVTGIQESLKTYGRAQGK